MSRKKTWLSSLSAMLFVILFLFSNIAYSGKFPERDITVLVPWPAGGGADMITRAFFKNAHKYYPVNVQIANVTGGGGIVGLSQTASAKPDGYTLCTFEINSLQGYYVQAMTKYNLLKDFTLINRIGFADTVLAVKKDSRFKSLKELIEYAKANPEKLNLAVGIGRGGCWHMPVALLMSSEKATVKYVYMQGGAPARTAAIGGHVDACAIGIMEASNFVKSGDLRVLGLFSEKRNPHHPDIPTVGEQGYPKIAMGVSFVLGAPKGLPKETTEALVNYSKKCFEDAEFKDLLDKQVLSVPDQFYGPEGTKRHLEENEARVVKILTDLGMAKEIKK